MIQTTEEVLRYLVYLLILISGWFVVSPLIKPSYLVAIKYKRYRNLNKSLEYREASYSSNPVLRHISNLLSVTINKRGQYSLSSFFIISLLISFVTAMLLISLHQPWTNVLMVAILLGLSPYVVLRVRLHTIRVDGSYEAEGLTTELSNQYRMNGLNMIEAIDQSIPNLKDFPHSRRALLRLSMAVKEMKNLEELDHIIQEFVFALDTEWSTLLGNNFYMSIGYRDDVSPALQDLIEELKEARRVREADKRENAESFFMVKYAAPCVYIASVLSFLFIFNFTLAKYWEYQFRNPNGFQSFTNFFVLFVISVVIYYLMRKPKNDF
ncbi:hypothetical protein ACFQ88_38970 [Paenibacillus sp. NPDC056579]|uniref:hypothetical protein n=1 Tax=Paenibacillus sp. NPDC056579 TaxID=3345871 RepID=UPI0036BE5062